MTEAAKRRTATFAEFLADTPPDIDTPVSVIYRFLGSNFRLSQPDVLLYCRNCDGMRYFESPKDAQYLTTETFKAVLMFYCCKNCEVSVKQFAILAKADNGGDSGTARKLGEFPPFGPQIPSRVVKLIGPDKDNFYKGRRSENLGLGIGAFAYYRQIVERQKSRIIDQIASVAERLGAKEELLKTFAVASKETRFKDAIDMVKEAMPERLLIKGQNPLILLHSALSEGLHEGSDDECLERAAVVRVILTKLAEGISQALQDEKEVEDALSRLLEIRSGKVNSSEFPATKPGETSKER